MMNNLFQWARLGGRQNRCGGVEIFQKLRNFDSAVVMWGEYL